MDFLMLAQLFKLHKDFSTIFTLTPLLLYKRNPCVQTLLPSGGVFFKVIH